MLSIVQRNPNYFVYSDASATGCGAHMVLNQELVCHKMCHEDKNTKSSTWRALAAIEFTLQSFYSFIEYSHLKWLTDNQAAAKIVEVGSMKKYKFTYSCHKDFLDLRFT